VIFFNNYSIKGKILTHPGLPECFFLRMKKRLERRKERNSGQVRVREDFCFKDLDVDIGLKLGPRI
jgi:hypothetical protein